MTIKESTDNKIAWLFSFKSWQYDSEVYMLVYAETEKQARELAANKCTYNNHEPARPEDLKLCTFFK